MPHLPLYWYRGAYSLPFFIKSACLSLYVCNTRRFYCLRELYGADFHNAGSTEAGEYGLTRGRCFVPCRLDVVAVAGLL